MPVNKTNPCLHHTQHFFYPLCDHNETKWKVTFFALNILSLGIPFTAFHIYRILSTKFYNQTPSIQLSNQQELIINVKNSIKKIQDPKESEFVHNLQVWVDDINAEPSEKRKEASEAIIKAYREKAPILSLRNLRLTSLPECLAELQSLESLQLSNNRLAALPRVILSLENLKDLQLQRNNILGLNREVVRNTLKNCEVNLIANPLGAANRSILKEGPNKSHKLIVTSAEKKGIAVKNETPAEFFSYWNERYADAFSVSSILEIDVKKDYAQLLKPNLLIGSLIGFLLKLDDSSTLESERFVDNPLKSNAIKNFVVFQVHTMLNLACHHEEFRKILFNKAHEAYADCHLKLKWYLKELEIAYQIHSKEHTDQELADLIIGLGRLELLESIISENIPENDQMETFYLFGFRLQLSNDLGIPLSCKGLKLAENVRENVEQNADSFKEKVLFLSSSRDEKIAILIQSEYWQKRIKQKASDFFECITDLVNDISNGGDLLKKNNDNKSSLDLRKKIFTENELSELTLSKGNEWFKIKYAEIVEPKCNDVYRQMTEYLFFPFDAKAIIPM